MKTYQHIEIPTGELITDTDGTYVRCDTNSSMVKSWSYLMRYKSLHITYNNDDTYIYDKVPASIVVALIACSSVGKTVNELVKKGGYEYEKIQR